MEDDAFIGDDQIGSLTVYASHPWDFGVHTSTFFGAGATYNVTYEVIA
jgi:hypothetical protein